MKPIHRKTQDMGKRHLLNKSKKPRELKKAYRGLGRKIGERTSTLTKTLRRLKAKNVRLDKAHQDVKILLKELEEANKRLQKEITGRKIIEGALRESEKKFKELFNEARDGILLADPDTKKFHMWNKTMLDMLGYDEDEIKSLGVMDIHPKEDLSSVLKHFERQARGAYKIADALRVVRKDGSIFFADVCASPVVLGGKKYLMGSFRDITDRIESEKALKASEENYRMIFESANDAIVIRDINTYRVTDVNSRACEMFCYSKKDMIGLPLNAFSADSARYPQEKVEGFYHDAAKGDPQFFEWPVKDRFGREFWVDVSLKRTIIGGQYRLLSIARDITERRLLSEHKENFMNMMSHELRTPLAAIKEGVSIVLESDTGTIGAEQKEILNIASRNIERLAKLVNQVFDLQKIDAGTMEFRLEENDINKVIKEIQRVMAPLAAKKKLEFSLELEDALPLIRFDKNKIIEVLINLVDNAIKFTEKGVITITSSREENIIRVSVEDTGPGIKGEVVPKLFQRFIKLTKGPSGSGLGLSISKEIIDAHKGRIWVESKFGEGSKFYFVLPIKERRA